MCCIFYDLNVRFTYFKVLSSLQLINYEVYTLFHIFYLHIENLFLQRIT
jgi:hypothetical protein